MFDERMTLRLVSNATLMPKSSQPFGLTDIFASSVLYAGQTSFVPLQATKVRAIIAMKTKEMRSFLIVIILSHFTAIKLVKKYAK